ncbi:MAG TPA: 5-oxoprolinase subunit PxpB, partial [Niastella sp.]|nr:5-oxoprolinase subunit PxpB [Niastella sp.]
QQNPLDGVIDYIPAYSSIAFVYDIIALGNKTGNSTVVDYLTRAITQRIPSIHVESYKERNIIEVPVCYDPSLGADLVALSTAHGLTEKQVVEIHCSRSYRVFMLGFLPGFAYMGKVDPRIVTPRLQQPRTKVAAGSVGIAGEQTGIYPVDSPGGWQLIGQTPLNIYDPAKANPCLFAPGDEVRFFPITLSEFQKMKNR